MKRIKLSDCPETLQAWFKQATEGKRRGNFGIFGHNDRFVLIKAKTHTYFDGIVNKERGVYYWLVVEWVQQKNLNTFHFKATGHLIKSHKAKIKKDYSISVN